MEKNPSSSDEGLRVWSLSRPGVLEPSVAGMIRREYAPGVTLEEENTWSKAVLKNHRKFSPKLQDAAADLVDLCTQKGYRVRLQPPDGSTACNRCEDSNFPSSMTCANCRTVWLNPCTGGRAKTPEEMVVSFGHEVGHVHDPPTDDDHKLVSKTPPWTARKHEREDTAWEWAERHLRCSGAWADVKDTFAESRRKSEAVYKAAYGARP